MPATQIAPSAPLAFPLKSSLIDSVLEIAADPQTHLTLKAEADQAATHDSYAFHRWRPRYHVMSPRGWMNDPCAPGYNPVTKTYHLGFQWNPKGCTWGNMSWGAALSRDLVSWEVSSVPSIEPGHDDDPGGVFTGCLQPTNLSNHADGSLTTFYTSAQRLPINHALPYWPGCERIHAATSIDNGKTWRRHTGNPIVAKPPDGWSVTGWRDPFLSSWESVDRLLGHAPGQHLYAITSGGLRDETPTLFLYQVDRQALDKWTSLGPIVSLGLNFRPSRWSGDFGVSWEVGNFLSLADEKGQSHDFVITGVEGSKEKAGGHSKPELIASHAQMWLCGSLSREKDTVDMRFKYGGALDHGSFYAANSFWDPVSEQRIIFGWIFEEDLPLNLVKRQGWSGCLSIPRVVKLTVITSVMKALKAGLQELSSMETVPDENGTFTVRTLTAMPDLRLKRLRHKQLSSTPSPVSNRTAGVTFPAGFGAQWELEASFILGATTTRIGFEILHSPGKSQLQPYWRCC